jgi:hypothetical protein
MSTDFSSYSVLRQASALVLAGSKLQDEVPGYSLDDQITLAQWALSIVPQDNPAYYGISVVEKALLAQRKSHDACISAILEYAMSIPEDDLMDITDAIKTKEEMEALLNDDDDEQNVCDDEDL